MVVTRIDDNAHAILVKMKGKLKTDGVAHPNLSEAIRYMDRQIVTLTNKLNDSKL